jgi:hypothetical protein
MRFRIETRQMLEPQECRAHREGDCEPIGAKRSGLPSVIICGDFNIPPSFLDVLLQNEWTNKDMIGSDSQSTSIHHISPSG